MIGLQKKYLRFFSLYAAVSGRKKIVYQLLSELQI